MRIDWSAVAKVGIPGVIAMFLVYNLATGFDKFDKRLQAMEVQHAHAATASAEAKDIAGRALMTNEKVLWVLRTICANEAMTAAARRDCLREP